ncbi:MAG: DNA-3-methyladenine glycosylase I [Salinisphaeraceae bacterium]
MTTFAPILAAAVARAGDEAVLRADLKQPEPPEGLAMVGDDRYLSLMTRRIFRAGLQHRMVDARWPAFEAAFADFDLDQTAALDEGDIKRLTQDESLIRHPRKLAAVRSNAIAMQSIREEFGSFGVWLARWPEDEIVELWLELNQRFSQLGGNSGPAFLRMAGKDTFLLTDWVMAGLRQWQAHPGPFKAKTAQREVQVIFNDWADEADEPLSVLSQILSRSIGELD